MTESKNETIFFFPKKNTFTPAIAGVEVAAKSQSVLVIGSIGDAHCFWKIHGLEKLLTLTEAERDDITQVLFLFSSLT